MLKHAINRFTPEPVKTYLQEALCEPVANDPDVGNTPVHPWVVINREGSTKWGTFGQLLVVGEDGGILFECSTLENPWKYNRKKESCIPNGTYTMKMRTSAVVKRTTGGEFKKGWEICDVPNRTFIMLHPGNWEKDTKGCVLVGKSHTIINGTPAVPSSRETFRELMEVLETQDEWTINVAQVLYKGHQQ